MIGFLPTPIPAVQALGGVARNEAIYDTELTNNGVNLLGTKITVFSSYNQFATVTAAPAGIAKQPGRDTNLSGSGTAGLPQGVQMFAYAWSNEIHAGQADLATFDNRVVFELINRFRRLSSASLVINQTNNYMTVRLPELVAFEDSLNVQTTQGSATVVTPFVGDRKGKAMTSTQRYQAGGGRIATVRNSPYIFQPLQNFRVVVDTPTVAAGVTLITPVPLWHVHKFAGITVRGIS